MSTTNADISQRVRRAEHSDFNPDYNNKDDEDDNTLLFVTTSVSVTITSATYNTNNPEYNIPELPQT